MHHHIEKLLLISVLIAVATCAPTTINNNDGVKLEKYEFKQLNDKNQYSFEYKTSDGQARNEVGTLKIDKNGDTKYFVEGSFEYTGPDGVNYYVWYTADENGFHPNGHHLPGAKKLVIVPQLSPNAIKSLIG